MKEGFVHCLRSAGAQIIPASIVNDT